MKKQLILLIILFSILMAWSSCEDYATGVDPLIDRVEDERLTAEGQVNFLINGVKARFSTTCGQTTVLGDLLADALFFDYNCPNATYPTWYDINNGIITGDNNSVDGVYNDVGELRFFADDLIRRAGEITFEDETLKTEALFIGNFYGAIARYFYAAYFGLNEQEGGGIIDKGNFIPSADMYNLALEKFDAALTYTDDDLLIRVINSLIARIYLYKEDYTNAETYAKKGLVEGDDPFQCLFSLESANIWYIHAGIYRTQGAADYRFHDYIVEDPNEANRVIIEEFIGNDDTTVYYRQAKYQDETAPLAFVSWQENELILAETELRAGNNAGALARINNIRSFHGIDALAAADLDVIYVERDKELCFTGLRAMDQRRFNKWHLVGTWQFLPITDRERNANPNIPEYPPN